jgi:hypothetical protein
MHGKGTNFNLAHQTFAHPKRQKPGAFEHDSCRRASAR